MKVSFNYTWIELARISLRAQFRMFRGIIILIFLIEFVLLNDIRIFDRPHIFLMAVSALTLLEIFIIPLFSAKRKLVLFGITTTFELSEQSLKIGNEYGNYSLIQLSYIVSIKKGSVFYELRLKNGISYFVPKRAFENNQDQEDFFNRIKEGTGSAILKKHEEILD